LSVREEDTQRGKGTVRNNTQHGRTSERAGRRNEGWMWGLVVSGDGDARELDGAVEETVYALSTAGGKCRENARRWDGVFFLPHLPSPCSPFAAPQQPAPDRALY
jgi:hypothetical protein